MFRGRRSAPLRQRCERRSRVGSTGNENAAHGRPCAALRWDRELHARSPYRVPAAERDGLAAPRAAGPNLRGAEGVRARCGRRSARSASAGGLLRRTPAGSLPGSIAWCLQLRIENGCADLSGGSGRVANNDDISMTRQGITYRCCASGGCRIMDIYARHIFCPKGHIRVLRPVRLGSTRSRAAWRAATGNGPPGTALLAELYYSCACGRFL